MPVHTKPIVAIHGKSTYLRRRALDRVIDRELTDGDRALNLRRVDGGQTEAAEVLDDVRTFSLLGGRRVVVVADADAFITRHRAVLERYAGAPSDSGCLIFDCNRLDARTKLYKVIQKAGEIIACEPVQGKALVPWIAATARDEHGKRMTTSVAARLCDLAGTSQEALDQELRKLALYVGERKEITVADVEDLVGHYREQNVFAVTDAIADGNAPAALAEWQQVLATDRAAPGRAIGGLAFGVRRLLDARRRVDAGESPAAMAREYWTDARKLADRMKRVTVRGCEDCLSALLEADLETKTGLGTAAGAIEKFIVSQSHTARA